MRGRKADRRLPVVELAEAERNPGRSVKKRKRRTQGSCLTEQQAIVRGHRNFFEKRIENGNRLGHKNLVCRVRRDRAQGSTNRD